MLIAPKDVKDVQQGGIVIINENSFPIHEAVNRILIHFLDVEKKLLEEERQDGPQIKQENTKIRKYRFTKPRMLMRMIIEHPERGI